VVVVESVSAHIVAYCVKAMPRAGHSLQTTNNAATTERVTGDAASVEECLATLHRSSNDEDRSNSGSSNKVYSGNRIRFAHAAVEVRQVPGHGAGLCVATEVPQGSLLFACCPFALTQRAGLQGTIIKTLRTCSHDIRSRFFSLYDGTNADRPLPTVSELIADLDATAAPNTSVDAARVDQIIKFNSIARDSLNEHGASREAELCGIWLLPAFLNHSCRPNVQLTFLEDLLLCRAARSLASGDELLVGYVSTFQPRHVRRARLKEDWAFECDCPRCVVEGTLVPAGLAKPLVRKLDLLVDNIEKRGLNVSAVGFAELAQTLKKEVSTAVDLNTGKLDSNAPLKAACTHLWGYVGIEDRSAKLKRLLLGSFLPTFKGTAFAWKQLGDVEQCLAAYDECLELFEEVCAGSAYHAHWAAICAVQASKGSRTITREVARRARYARHWNAVCHGQAAYKVVIEKLGWPYDLLEAAQQIPGMTVPEPHVMQSPAGVAKQKDVASLCDPRATTSTDVRHHWDYSLVATEDGGILLLTLPLPEGVQLADVDLDVANDSVQVSCRQKGPSDPAPLRVQLPQKVDAANTPPAKYKKQHRQLILKLPVASGTGI